MLLMVKHVKFHERRVYFLLPVSCTKYGACVVDLKSRHIHIYIELYTANVHLHETG